MFPYKYSVKPEYLDDSKVVDYVNYESVRLGISNLIEPVDTTKHRRNMRLAVSTMNTLLPQHMR